MSYPIRGFSLLEVLLALSVGLVLVLGVSQVAVSARATHASQQAAMQLQDDARFALGKLIQDIRQAGMFGCLAPAFIENAPPAFDRPIAWVAGGGSASLTLVTADVAGEGGKPDWTVLSDCTGTAQAYTANSPAPAPGQSRFALRQLTYSFEAGQLKVSTLAAPAKTVLVDNVQRFDVSFGMAAKFDSTRVERYDASQADASLIRSVRIVLTLHDPAGRVKDQTYSVVAALRNRLG
ncbi:prepilin-type N-terminal cleavage/methylation domain-containing protein [Pseudomonas syringae]|uniref:Prepilin-type N-terminal cleavage/methylation domain-containing protein n=1 Tax=Pseudomonas syringae TaxID=317 RepID=A0A9Q3WZL6_PSESX|nr:prepilin-type N-terminal cleavage/methylation domain-containing protein [Pseudomonas syringae]MCF5061519.1 prepilin-type N-terminal cleavage/methylation domain-containing protein [Pseudomonas syringae]MCF5075457.1 prepilin-type N-terminal cleavage/methylation domain-containing protein [Pseudomonas syringae]MCF5119916.1 prepilin-type N-terminal cleavage/methylation domain-containing protein [Pseudomonas syringae]MCF5377912.1 prepilin-type N-terminal cleavage/methylation domain-containing prot